MLYFPFCFTFIHAITSNCPLISAQQYYQSISSLKAQIKKESKHITGKEITGIYGSKTTRPQSLNIGTLPLTPFMIWTSMLHSQILGPKSARLSKMSWMLKVLPALKWGFWRGGTIHFLGRSTWVHCCCVCLRWPKISNCKHQALSGKIIWEER